MMLGARTAAWAKSGGWVNPYVTDGLVAMWDGEWNAGGGIHDPNATVWKDLIGDNDLTVQNGTWGSDGLITPNSDYTVNPAIGSKAAIPLSADILIDINMVFNYSRNTYVLEFGDNQHILTLERNSGFITRHEGRVFSFDWGMKRIAVHVDYKNDRLFVNGAEVVDRGGYNTWSTSALVVLFGYSGNSILGARRCYFGKYLAIRPYEKVLNPDEIASNYAIDKARFGLT